MRKKEMHEMLDKFPNIELGSLKYINTRPLFEKIKSGNYSYYMENRIRNLEIKDYYISQRKTSASGAGVGKVNYYMSRAEWNKIKASL